MLVLYAGDVPREPDNEPVVPPDPSTASSLIGLDDLEPPDWVTVDEQVVAANLWRTLRGMPRAVRLVVGLAWGTARRLTLLAAIVQVLSGCVTAFGLLATANVFTSLLEAGPTPHRVVASLPAIALVVGSYAARALLDGIVAAVQGALVPRVRHAARDAVYEAIVEVDLLAWEDADFRELVRQGAQTGVSRVETAIRGTADVTSSLVSMVAAVATVGVLNPWLAPVLLIAAAADGWTAMRVAKLGYESFLRIVSQDMRRYVLERLIGERDLAMERHALTLHGTLLAEDRRISSGITAEAVALARRQNRVRMAGRALAGLGSGAAYTVLGVLLYVGAMPLALAATAVVAMRTASTALANTMQGVNELFEDSLYLGFYRRLLADARARSRPRTGVIAPADPSVIRLEHVSFSYPGADSSALTDVDLTIRRGEVVALVGQNGSGKSTLAMLLTGLYRPTTGRVLWDDVDLASADAESVHSRIAVIAQDPARWPMSAASNVRVGRLEHDDPDGQRWASVLRMSGADEVVAALPHGPQTVLSKQFRGGHDLSTGQWQRIGIARGAYRDAPILIADEPTAALDAKAEARVFAGLEAASRTSTGGPARTTVLITHRLANTRPADRIVVLDGGRVVEEGTHDTLISHSGGLYRELFEIQAQAYRTD